MMIQRTRSFALMLSVAGAAAIAATSSYATEAAAPGSQQRNEGVGVRGGQSAHSAQSGQGASPQGGQGAATQMGTPPGQLKREEEARQRGQASGGAGK
ncbi:hypothetical protein [Caballeronia grimmiae]|uniref:Uncharacterized protein n=1 Tax=Caballeronia grimmiae TaxID=1071679 RepID=A0A069PAP0_9BURK|nr:hypothetical protein [Caballeronia grimmiae]KDR36919.1 hypothetical protein BG57_11190 [Caballeronia grimmiae]GGD76326.1 hypothetical protein GCM10010985_33580 [Caballeronia grimmiae]